jgi:ribosomal RNA-processing protein 8
MFAVPGWSVPADQLLSAQPNAASPVSPTADPSPLDSRSKPRKRRRDEPDQVLSDPRITSERLHKLWKKEFGASTELRQPPSEVKKKKKKKENKKNKKKEEREKQDLQTAATKNHDNSEVLKTADRTGSNVHENAASIPKEGVERHKELRPGRKRKKEQAETSFSGPKPGKAVDELDANKRTPFVEDSEHEKFNGHSKATQHDKKAQRATQKVTEMPFPAEAKFTPLQAKMRDKLTSARFRHLNETLYTSPSSASLELFTASPDLFAEYHAGFARQVKDSWPQNPVDGYIHDIKIRANAESRSQKEDLAVELMPLPRRKTGSCTVVDLGCGDAPLARALQSSSRALRLKFHNFDLHTPNSLVTKADIADLPLRDGEADIAVFCLSLMGTNWISFIEEAWRVLRGDGKGELWIAEVKSRFGRATGLKVVENSIGKKQKPKARPEKRSSLAEDETEAFMEDEDTAARDETDISAFRDVIQRRGFALRTESLNKENKMFVTMIFNKTGIPAAGKHQGLKWNGHEYEVPSGMANGRKRFIDQSKEDDRNISAEDEAKVLKPCVYKKR